MAAIDFNKHNATIHAEYRTNGLQVAVTLRDGSTFNIRGFERRRSGEELSDGLTQQDYWFRVVKADWDGLAGRPPDKGDQLVIGGRRHAIEESHHHALAGLYMMRLRG